MRFVRGKWRASLRGEYLGTFDTEQEGLDAVNATIDIDAGKAPDSLHTFGEKWLDDRELGGDIRGIEQERSVWRQHVADAEFYDWPLKRVRPIDVQNWLNALAQKDSKTVKRKRAGVEIESSGQRVSRQTVVHARRVLRACFQQACIAGKCPANPVDQCITPKMAEVREDEDEWTWLSLPEIERLFAAIELCDRPEFYGAWYAVAIYGGLSLEEIKGLRWIDVSLRDREIRVRQSSRGPLKAESRRRTTPMLRPLHAALQRWQRAGGAAKVQGLVFPADHGSFYGHSYDAAWETQWRAKSGCRPFVRFHDLRHTCASHLVMGTWGRAFKLIEVRDWLGHADVQTTQRYAHLAPGALAATVREMEANEKHNNRRDEG